jgi:hypothetical protein
LLFKCGKIDKQFSSVVAWCMAEGAAKAVPSNLRKKRPENA